MQDIYADVIIDISSRAVDRVFQYRIPEELRGRLSIGQQVRVPFGNGGRLRDGYIVAFGNEPVIDPSRIKSIGSAYGQGTSEGGTGPQLIRLAAWMSEYYGSTMIAALKVVLPPSDKAKPLIRKYIVRAADEKTIEAELEICRKGHQTARARLLEALAADEVLPLDMVRSNLKVTKASYEPLIEKGLIKIIEEESFRDPLAGMRDQGDAAELNPEQRLAVQSLKDEWEGQKRPCLLHGVTGSGKTEVYMEFISHVIGQGYQAIVLIPEIALTWQTAMRFYRRFGKRISISNSRMTAAERADQARRAARGDIDIMIGPRSAVFTPFERLGLIVIDEEQEPAYKSENTPRYSAVDAAIERCRLAGAMTVMGSATPSVCSYYRARTGEYRLLTLKNRARGYAHLPDTQIVDMREELSAGNKSIISRRLYGLMKQNLEKKEQTVLFINRRGYAGFVSCRSCGKAMRCPHCDVALKAHSDGMLKCHYCGYEEPIPRICPKCGSRYIAGFGVGTEKVERLLGQLFPDAGILRMDMDTTSGKGGHDKILSAFADRKADILIGTQMVAKGHDLPSVTLVGILAADLTLGLDTYTAGERTFQLLTQAAGRAGRDVLPGRVIIQTYSPDSYCIQAAAQTDYEGFYRQEMIFRELLGYPPFCSMLSVMVSSQDEAKAKDAADAACRAAREDLQRCDPQAVLAGPAQASVFKVNDIYRYMIYVKSKSGQTASRLIQVIGRSLSGRDVYYQFDRE